MPICDFTFCIFDKKKKWKKKEFMEIANSISKYECSLALLCIFNLLHDFSFLIAIN